MPKNSNAPRPSSLRPAFLTESHRGLSPVHSQPRKPRRWQPNPQSRQRVGAVEAIPKLTAALGFSLASSPDTSVELLPGHPTTVAFTSGGQLKGLVVLPVDQDEARRTLGLPTVTTNDLAVDALFEEERERPALPDEMVVEANGELW